MNLLKKELEAEKYVRKVYIYNGTLSHPERTSVLEATKAPLVDQHDILLIQLQSGGVGINLQHFDRIIFSGPWWTSALMNQAIARAVRIGQKKVVEVYHLKLEDENALNIDAIMMEKANSKGELCKQVLEMATRDLEPSIPKKKFHPLMRKAPEKQETPQSKEE
jgi:SNF2 family DNA or RNA helicase